MKKALLLLVVGAAALAVVLLVRAGIGGAPPTRSPERPSLSDADAALARFSEALTYRTISPGSDSGQARDPEPFLAFHAFVERAFPRVHATLEREVVGKFALLYRWPGTSPQLDPVVLLGHFDVVPVDPASLESWTHPPFSGEIADGTVWGRGTLDNKVNVVGLLEAAERLLAEGFTPERTLYLSFGADEELGGKQGAARVAERMRGEGHRIALVVDEGGAVLSDLLPGQTGRLAFVGVAEKGSTSIELRVETEGGHSSLPSSDNAIGTLATAIHRLEQQPMPSRYDGLFRDTLTAAAPTMGLGARVILLNQWLFGPLIEAALVRQGRLAPMLRTTTAPTIFQAGIKENVLPTSARAIVNFRLFPGDTAETVLQHVRRAVDDDRVQLTQVGMRARTSRMSKLSAPGGVLLANTIAEAFGGIPVAPVLIPGGTDARYFRDLSDAVFGFTPVALPAADVRRAHGLDERIPAASYLEGVGFYNLLLRESAAGGWAASDTRPGA